MRITAAGGAPPPWTQLPQSWESLVKGMLPTLPPCRPPLPPARVAPPPALRAEPWPPHRASRRSRLSAPAARAPPAIGALAAVPSPCGLRRRLTPPMRLRSCSPRAVPPPARVAPVCIHRITPCFPRASLGHCLCAFDAGHPVWRYRFAPFALARAVPLASSRNMDLARIGFLPHPRFFDALCRVFEGVAILEPYFCHILIFCADFASITRMWQFSPPVFATSSFL